MIKQYLSTFIELIRQFGLRFALTATRKKLRQLSRRRRGVDRAALIEILRAHAGQPIIIFPPVIDWHVPLFQRPHHLAINLARQGFLYFFCTPNMYDDFAGFTRQEDNLYITDCYDEVLELAGTDAVLHLYAQNPAIQLDFVQAQLERGNQVLYEYIDEIHGDLGLDKAQVIDRHRAVLADERCLVVATASKLMAEVLQYRQQNCQLVSNGVDCQHFSQQFSREQAPLALQPLLASGQPIIGYFGALASWFDYELVIRLATERPEYQLLLVGWDYDTSLQVYRLDQYPNITVIGPIPYAELPQYAHWFTVSTIPFRINEVTESTSPIKLFEYMALGHPIVTTDMPECRKYRSVLIGHDHAEFITRIDEALALRGNAAYAAVLQAEAEENSWEAKAVAINGLIRENIPATFSSMMN